MHYTILCPSPLTNDANIDALIKTYTKRMDFEVVFKAPKVKVSQSDSDDVVKRKQADALLSEMDKMKDTLFVAMDENGKNNDSIEFAKMIADAPLQNHSSLCFVIGGAFGLHDDISQKCQKKISFGRMVWPHRLVGLMLTEQLYRAEQINKGHPYHKA